MPINVNVYVNVNGVNDELNFTHCSLPTLKPLLLVTVL